MDLHLVGTAKGMQGVDHMLEAMLLAQAVRPLFDKAGAAGAYAAETFAKMLVTEAESRR